MKNGERISIEGNKGGSYITIEQTSREDVVTLEVGHDCVVTIKKQEINVYALAAILTAAKREGFYTVVAKESRTDGVPEWALPVSV